jgi:hypothetical protein
MNYLQSSIPTSVPHRFSEASFTRFAPYISLAIKEHPGCIIIDPSTTQLSVETFACRFRDAITAWGMYGYTNHHLPDRNQQSLAASLVTSIHQGKVLIGTRDAIRRETQAKPSDATIQTPEHENEILVFKNPIFLRMLCDMLAQRAFDPVPKFIVHGLDASEVEALNRDYDVMIVEDGTEKGKFYIL